MDGTFTIHKKVDEAFRCRGEHSCYPGADDMTGCTCLREMQAAMPGKCQVLDSVKAKKALACVEEISNALSSAITSYGFCEKVETILRRYGQP